MKSHIVVDRKQIPGKMQHSMSIRPRSRSSNIQRNSSEDGAPGSSKQARKTSPRKISRKGRREEFNDSETESDAPSDTYNGRPRKARRTMSHISVCGPAYPRSQYQGYIPPLPITNEVEAVSDLERAHDSLNASPEERPEYTYFKLDNFSIYRPDHKSHAYELGTLDRLQNRGGFDEYLFDGVLSVGSERRYVQGVRFSVLAIDGYGDPDVVDLSDRISIQSRLAIREGVWYQLGEPSQEYRRFLEPFLWLAQFTKHFVEYLLDRSDLGERDVTLEHFRRNFHGWLFARYSDRATCRSWLARCRLRDFRTTVAAHVGFLWKECSSIDDNSAGLRNHPIWAEVDYMKLTAIPRQPQIEKHTIVTPFVWDCFKHMYFADHLEPRSISDCRVSVAVAKRKQALGLAPFGVLGRGNSGLPTPQSERDSPDPISFDVHVGNVVCVRPDTEGRWKTSSPIWYAYVRGVRMENYTTKLDVIWFYEPRDTTLGNAYYPVDNELFLSDNCACGSDAIDIRCVIGKVQVLRSPQDPASSTSLFVRQKFRTIHDEDTYDFVSLKSSDFTCGCRQRTSAFEECRLNFAIGDNILFREYNEKLYEDTLEPAQVIDFLLETQRVVLRRLKRATESNNAAKPNELILTSDIFSCPPTKIIRKCRVRFFHPDVVQEGLPTPYDQNGAGDHFFMVRRSEISRVVTLAPGSITAAIPSTTDYDAKLPPLEEGWDPGAPPPKPKMQGMGIFCGGGNYDRGFEDAGAVDFKFAVDYAEHALHSYRANVKSNEGVQLFLGSVDDYLAQALAGSVKAIVAQAGEVDVLTAGSPCPGFSRANIRKADFMALRNSSMVASVVSYVDFYSPQYCILENVVTMTDGMGPNKDENVFTQILASLVAMGYQVQQFLMDAWCFGSSQRRSRVFIIASAPGLQPLPTPPYTHGHPNDNHRQVSKALGRSSNGLPFGARREDYTPFEHVSPMQATQDLPNVGHSQPQLCPEFPDHRTPFEATSLARSCMAVVPKHPRGMGFVQAVKQTKKNNFWSNEKAWCSPITGDPLNYYEDKVKRNPIRNSEKSNCYARIHPDDLFPTLLTALGAEDGINGRTLHWDELRTLTVMEARRAQGFHDHEVIIGSTAQQMRIIGNSVDRKVALALGLSLRDSWLKGNIEPLYHVQAHVTSESVEHEVSKRR